MTELEACPHCHRHVKVEEATCPFCARSLREAFANRTLRSAPQRRLGRAATFAFGLGVVVTQGACNEDENAQQDAGTPDAGHDAATPDAGDDAATPDSGTQDSDGGYIPIYAAAPTPDNGSRVAIRLPTDASRDKA